MKPLISDMFSALLVRRDETPSLLRGTLLFEMNSRDAACASELHNMLMYICDKAGITDQLHFCKVIYILFLWL